MRIKVTRKIICDRLAKRVCDYLNSQESNVGRDVENRNPCTAATNVNSKAVREN